MTAQCSNTYLATQIRTSDPISLVISLYEEAIASVAKAMKAIENKDDNTRRNTIRKAGDILMALTEALDFTQQEQLAGRLFALYNFQMQRLLQANRNQDIEALQEVKSTLSILLSGWQEAARANANEPAHNAKDRHHQIGRPGPEHATIALTA